MHEASVNFKLLAATSKRLGRRLLTMCENRLELLMLEVQEERDRLLHAILLALAVAIFGLLAGIALSICIVVCLWNNSPLVALLSLTSLYALAAVWFYWRLTFLQRHWKTLPATLDQLRKDRECLEKGLA